MNGITTVFMHMYYFPIILLAYHYHKKGVAYSVLLTLTYLAMVVYFDYARSIEILGALLRSLSFIGVAAVVAYLSIYLEKRQLEYRTLYEFNQGIVSNANVWLSVLDEKGKILVWNRAAEDISGYTTGEVIGKNNIWKQLYPENEYRKKITQTISKIISEKRFFENFETVILTKNHTRKTISWNTRAVSGEDGSLNHFIAIGIDITERKRAEDALHTLAADHTTIINNAPAMIWYKDTKNNFIRINPAAAKAFGKSVEEIEGKNACDLFPDLAEKFYDDDMEVIKTGIPKIGTVEQMLTSPKEGLWVQTDKIPLKNEQGKVTGVMVFVVDITKRKMAEDALALASKKLNLLSSITRHDILNQLTALRGYLELSHSLLRDPDALEKFIEKEEKAASTIEHQITFTRNYQDLGVKAPVWQNVNNNIRKVVTQLPMQEIHVDVDRPDLEIFADPLFEKVFYNLIDNALRYGGDKLSAIRVSSQESGLGLTIVCEDDGVGISENDKIHLFTQGFGKNTGFGLFLSREILSITDITITENGTPGKGARFEITVPKGKYRFSATGQK